MHSRFRSLVLIGVLAALTGCGDDNEDNNNDQINNPAEVPTPTPTPGFKWATVRFDHKDVSVMPPPPGYCNGVTRFEVKADGSYRFHDPCQSPTTKSGKLTDNEFGVLDAQMNGVSKEEASTKLKCTDFNDDLTRPNQRLSMTSTAKTRYALFTRNNDQECVSGNPAEIAIIRDDLYALQSKYGVITP